MLVAGLAVLSLLSWPAVPRAPSKAASLRHVPWRHGMPRLLNAQDEIASVGSPPTSDAVPAAREPEPRARDAMDITLDLLEWDRLSSAVATFASTRRTREELAGGLPVRLTRAESEVLQAEMEEAWTLEQVRASPIELRGFSDIGPLVTHASKGGILEGSDLIGIAEALAAAAKLVRTLRAQGGSGSAAAEASEETDEGEEGALANGGGGLFLALFDGLPVHADLRLALVDALDESGSVRDSADPSLGEIRFAQREVAKAARTELGRLIQLKGEALATRSASLRDDRFVLQVLAKQKHRVPGVVRDVSASGSTLYIEPKQIEPVNTKLRQLAKREKAIERVVLKQLSARIGSPKVAAELVALQAAVTRVDAAAARARFSAKLEGTPVSFCDAVGAPMGVQLSQLRHPLLVWPNTAAPPEPSRMVPMDVDVPPSVRAVVITGPNTGGKTVILKTLGMAALMAKAGLRVLCEADAADGRVTVPFYESVMCAPRRRRLLLPPLPST